MMAQARAKYAANPDEVRRIRVDARAKLPKPLPPTPEELDCNERSDRAISQSQQMLDEARAQFAAPPSAFLPAELAPPEIAEQEAAERWTQGYELADRTTDRMLQRNDGLFNDVMGLIDDFKESGIPIPDDVEVPSPPSTPTLQQLNVPQQVKEWITDSKAPLQKAHGQHANTARPSILASSQARHAAVPELTKLAATGKSVRSVETDGKQVPNLVARHDGPDSPQTSLK